MRGHVKFAVWLAGLSVLGCANVKVNKVPLAARIQQSDDRIKGFRYYLNRPYIVVAQRVPVMTTYIPLRQGTSGGMLALRSLVPNDAGQLTIYDAHGNVAANQTDFVETPTTAATAAPVPGPSATAADRNQMTAAVLSNTAIALANTFLKPSDALQAAAMQSLNAAVAQASSPQEMLKSAATQIKSVPGVGLDNNFDQSIATLGQNFPFDDFTGNDKALYAATVSLACTAEIVNQLALGTPKVATTAADLLSLYKMLSKPTIAALSASSQTDPKTLQQLALTTVQGLGTNLNQNQRKVLKSIDAARLSALLLQSPIGGQSVATIRADAPSNGKAADSPPADQSGAPIDSFQVAFLPDFEEQYAIRNYNCLAKAKYQMQFRHGTTLTGFAGSYDSTDVPVKLLQTVGTLITEAGNVAKAAIDQTPASTSRSLTAAPAADFYLKSEHVIEPGFYRVQKSWERVACLSPEGLAAAQYGGLFADIGLALIESHSILTPSEFTIDKTATLGADPTVASDSK